jgi:hypothetical protein
VHPSARKLPPFDVTPFLSLPATHQFKEKQKKKTTPLTSLLHQFEIFNWRCTLCVWGEIYGTLAMTFQFLNFKQIKEVKEPILENSAFNKTEGMETKFVCGKSHQRFVHFLGFFHISI